MKTIERRSLWLGGLAGILYGLLCRLVFVMKINSAWAVMTLGFLLFMPLAAGFISVYLAEREERRGPLVWFGLPAGITVTMLLGSFLLFWEGIICTVMMLPIALVTACIGGGIGALCARKFGPRTPPLVCAALLPFLMAPVEHWIGPANEVRVVRSAIDIDAPASVVWPQIARVAAIEPNEQQFSWTQKIGFPRPIEATLSHEGVGAIRHATFAGDVLFIETVTAWEPEKRLAFRIQADTASIPMKTLDEHVTIGGPYFDTLEGEYRIVPLDGGRRTRLLLASRHRLSTTFNFYASLWTDGVMQDVQSNILHVIRNRCERGLGR